MLAFAVSGDGWITFFIAGGIIIEVEDKLDETQAIWLGEQLDKDMREGQKKAYTLIM